MCIDEVVAVESAVRRARKSWFVSIKQLRANGRARPSGPSVAVVPGRSGESINMMVETVAQCVFPSGKNELLIVPLMPGVVPDQPSRPPSQHLTLVSMGRPLPSSFTPRLTHPPCELHQHTRTRHNRSRTRSTLTCSTDLSAVLF